MADRPHDRGPAQHHLMLLAQPLARARRPAVLALWTALSNLAPGRADLDVMRQAFNVAVLVGGGASSVPLSCGLRAGPARRHRQGVAVVPVGACREPWHPMARSWPAMRRPVALESLVSAVCTIPPPSSAPRSHRDQTAASARSAPQAAHASGRHFTVSSGCPDCLSVEDGMPGCLPACAQTGPAATGPPAFLMRVIRRWRLRRRG